MTQRRHLLPASPKDERVPSLEAYDDLHVGVSGKVDKSLGDVILTEMLGPAALSHVDEPARVWNSGEKRLGCKVVVHDRVSSLQQVHAPHGDEQRVSRTASDEIDRRAHDAS
jgi:hypothetical protein